MAGDATSEVVDYVSAPSTRRILLIEDNPVDAALAMAVTRDVDPALTWMAAGTLEQGLLVAESEHPDCVLLDLSLPDSASGATLRAVSEFPPDIPVVILTGSLDQLLAVEALQRGADDFVAKRDLDGENLARTIRHAIGRHDVRRAEAADTQGGAHSHAEESVAILDGVLASAPVGFGFMDLGYRLIRVNQNLADMTGRPCADHTGRSAAEMMPDLWPQLEPICQRVVATGGPVADEPVRVAYTDHRPDREWRATAYPVTVSGEMVGIGCILADVTERARLYRATRESNRLLRLLVRADAAVLRAHGESELLAAMCDVVVDDGRYSRASVVTQNSESLPHLRQVATSGRDECLMEALQPVLASDTSVAPIGQVFTTQGTSVVQDISSVPESPSRDLLLSLGYGSLLGLPINTNSGTYGTLVIQSDETDVFDEDEIGLLDMLVRNLGSGLDALHVRASSLEYLRRLQNMQSALITVISSAVEVRDPYTAGHQRRVAALAEAIAIDLGLDDGLVADIRTGATIHDIGKLAIPAEILVRPGRLSAAEFELVREHPEVGYRIVSEADLPEAVAAIIRQHHERLDGSGYPVGLAGDAIDLGARIVAVADVVEAMSSHRPYRAALGVPAALAEMKAGAGTLYDAAAAAACVGLFTDGRFRWD